MFDVSFGELAIIFVVALLVLGPEKLPKVAKTVGRILGQLQQHASHLKQELAREGELAELRKLHEETTRNLQEVGQQLISPLHEAEQQLQEASQSPHSTTPAAHLSDEEVIVKSDPTPTEEVATTAVAVAATTDSTTVPTTDVITVPAEDAEGQLDLFASQQPSEKHA